MKKGSIFLILGLVVGLSIAYGIGAFKRYIGAQLIGLLQDEVVNACPCKLEYDWVDVSFLTLSAAAGNVRMVENGEPRLLFKRVEGDFSLRDIGNHHFLLTELRLIDGWSKGVGPNSATYKFIDYLAAPSPPGTDYPGRWKLVLDGLTAEKASFTEPLGGFQAEGSGITLKLKRTPSDDFELASTVEKLDLTKPAQGTEPAIDIPVGKGSVDMFIEDDYIQFKTVNIDLNKSFLKVSSFCDTKHNDELDGKFNYSVNSEDLPVPPWLRFIVQGTGALKGEIDSPDTDATVSNEPGQAVKVELSDSLPISFEKFLGLFNFKFKDQKPLLSVSSIQGEGELLSFSNKTPLVVSENGLSGAIEINSRQINVGEFGLKGLEATAVLDGPFSNPLKSLNGSIQESAYQKYSPGPIQFSFNQVATGYQTKISSSSFAQGSIEANGLILLGPDAPPAIKEITFNLKDVAPTSLQNATSDANQGVRLDAKGTISGEFRASSLAVDSEFTLFGGPLKGAYPLNGRLGLKRGILDVDIKNRDSSLKSQLRLALMDSQGNNGLLTLNLADFKPFQELNLGIPSEQECGSMGLAGSYSFNLSQPVEGKGSIDISALSIGCEPNLVRIEKKTSIPISQGTATLPQICLKARDTSITLSGKASLKQGFDVSATGHINLESLLPFVSSLDDLDGTLSATLLVKGPFKAPTLSGSAQIKDASFDVESSNLSAEAIAGEMVLKDSTIEVKNVSGVLNEGNFKLSGSLIPESLSSSRMSLTLDSIILNPLEDLTLAVSGNLDLGQSPSGTAIVEGQVTVDSATFEKIIDWTTIARSIGQTIFQKKSQALQVQSASHPQIDLNIHIGASRNLIINSNLAGAELSADLMVAGSIERPVIRGGFQTLSGWYGLRDRQFTITDGLISFQPGNLMPVLQIVGETTIRSREGDNIVIIMDINGPATSPRIRLSSDRGLSERDLLALLTSSGDLIADQPRVSTLSQDVEIDTLPFLSDESILGLGGLLKRLTKIDSVSLEPSFNSLRGTVDPTAVVRKRLFEKILLVGESTLGSTPSETQFRAIYQFLPWMKFAGIVDADSTRNYTSVGVDVTFSILSDYNAFINLDIQGNHAFQDSEFLRQIRVNETSHLRKEDLSVVENSVRSAYASLGYFKTSASVECPEYYPGTSPWCKKLRITINEGEPSHIKDVSIRGDPLPSGVSDSCLEPSSRKLASLSYLKSCISTLTSKLRSEGYISSRVDGAYEQDSAGESTMIIGLRTGNPVTFTFTGNTVFSPKDFLATINLFERKQPFGKNTINILVDNIDRLYREAGYLFVTVRQDKETHSETSRITHHIEIAEGEKISVSEVRLSGNNLLTTEQIRSLLAIADANAPDRLFDPSYAVAEEIEHNVDRLKQAYADEGFSDTTISYKLIPNDEEKTVAIEYTIIEGILTRSDWIRVAGLPEGFTPPPPPPAPYSITRANTYIDSLINSLCDEGYFSASVSSTQLPEENTFAILIDPGPRTIIHSVNIEGNDRIATQTIQSNLAIQANQPWRASDVLTSKRNLLRLGLFSKVSIEPANGKPEGPKEDLVVKVVERDLSTLEVGGGLNSEYGLHIFGQATDRSLFADGKSLSARLDTYYDRVAADISQGVASFTYSDPALQGSQYGLVEDLRFQRLQQTSLEYDLDRVSLASYLHRSFDDGTITLTGGHTVLIENLDDVPSDAVLSHLDVGTNTLSFLSATMNMDRRDDPLNPHTGYNWNINTDFSWRGFGSDADYYSLGSRFSWIRPLPFAGQRFSIASGTSAASAWVFDGTTYMPISERYYLGGRNSVRGYGENSLGPRGDEGSVIGGDLCTYENLELRYLLGESTSLHLFFDAGGLFLKKQSVAWDEVKTSTGVGFRYFSPIGPIGIEIGFPLNPDSYDDSYRVHFNIGTNF